MQLKITNLKISIDKKCIIKKFDANLKTGDILAISGMNGEGKTTIIKSIMNHFSLQTSGSIMLDKNELTKLDTYQISQLGVFYIPQNSPELNGIQTLSFLRNINKNRNNLDFTSLYKDVETAIKKLSLPHDILSRDLNVGFSGGQKKKVELLQAIVFKPNVLLIDEIDSGVDTDSLNTIADFINKEKNKTITIIISHNTNFLNKIKPNKVCIINDGIISKAGNYDLIKTIEKNGFTQFIKNKKIERTSCLLKKK
ncbi:MAG: Fe-S cluster assembly ATPase SufC [Mycoplasmoidaceae bacterium]|nr:MAG: Fe-S cluster assembly ATPase SufC [Mycoplasmoidaceae bacterium]